MNKLPSFPRFDSFACVGDSRSVEYGDYTITATLHEDTDGSPEDFDCYSERQKARWRNDEWRFVGVVLDVKFRDTMVAKHAAGLWGVDCNFNKRSNGYLSQAADELLPEALDVARQRLDRLLAAIGSLQS